MREEKQWIKLVFHKMILFQKPGGFIQEKERKRLSLREKAERESLGVVFGTLPAGAHTELADGQNSDADKKLVVKIVDLGRF